VTDSPLEVRHHRPHVVADDLERGKAIEETGEDEEDCDSGGTRGVESCGGGGNG
jgi:hypothetical protein